MPRDAWLLPVFPRGGGGAGHPTGLGRGPHLPCTTTSGFGIVENRRFRGSISPGARKPCKGIGILAWWRHTGHRHTCPPPSGHRPILQSMGSRLSSAQRQGSASPPPPSSSRGTHKGQKVWGAKPHLCHEAAEHVERLAPHQRQFALRNPVNGVGVAIFLGDLEDERGRIRELGQS